VPCPHPIFDRSPFRLVVRVTCVFRCSEGIIVGFAFWIPRCGGLDNYIFFGEICFWCFHVCYLSVCLIMHTMFFLYMLMLDLSCHFVFDIDNKFH
jgi:hypothetical protein